MSARAEILAALAAPAHPGAALAGGDRAATAAALAMALEHPPGGDGDLLIGFCDRLDQPSLGATHARVAEWAALPDAVARYLDAQGVARALYLPPDPRLDALDWSGVIRLDACPIDDGAALAVAVGGVAETGSLVLDTGVTAAMLPNFLALYHIVVVEAARIVRWLEDVPASAATPRQRTLVTGVSGTTDIEGQYVRGAHGPRFLHVIVIGAQITD